MIIDDALKSNVKNHLANWRTLRGGTPFYSGMFWPQSQPDKAAEQATKDIRPDFPAIIIKAAGLFGADEIRAAKAKYPLHASVIASIEELSTRLNSEHETHRSNIYSVGRSMGETTAIDILKKASQIEREMNAKRWNADDVTRFAIKVDTFAQRLGEDITIYGIDGIHEIDFPLHTRGNAFFGSSRRWTLGNNKYKGAETIISKHAIAGVSIQNDYDAAATAADICSQGYDSILIWDGMGQAFCVDNHQEIKSIRAMQKHLGATVPSTMMQDVNKHSRGRSKTRYCIRPFIKATHGLRVFVTNGEVVAATVQRSQTIPSSQTEPFTSFVGVELHPAVQGTYRTEFSKECHDPQLFDMFMKRAKEIATDLRDIDIHDYALDMIIDENDCLTVDIFNLIDVDYHALCPSVIANAVARDLAARLMKDNEFPHSISHPEILEIFKAFNQSANIPLKFTAETHRFDDTNARFKARVENIASVRDLLRVSEGSASQGTIGTDEVWLIHVLALAEKDAAQYELTEFASSIHRDFLERYTGDHGILKNRDDLISLVPLLDAALWFRGRQDQSWRYSKTNQSDEFFTVRPINSGLSRAEQRDRYSNLMQRDDPFGSDFNPTMSIGYPIYDENADDIGVMRLKEVPEITEAQLQREDETVTDFFATLLESDDD
jgi:hypothetical protein